MRKGSCRNFNSSMLFFCFFSLLENRLWRCMQLTPDSLGVNLPKISNLFSEKEIRKLY